MDKEYLEYVKNELRTKSIDVLIKELENIHKHVYAAYEMDEWGYFYSNLDESKIVTQLVDKKPIREKMGYYNQLNHLIKAAYNVGNVDFAIKLEEESDWFAYRFLG